ncbi:MAG: hypothetical protein QOC61_337 [Acidobacteriota bacterium]|nr:hypothetical protein [Acidobacteriota bacterium]MDT7780976.1 hypothetical protein [Acidobacteriota bacterium]
MASRLLKQSEIDFARQVFEDQVPYGKVHLASYYLPGNHGVAVTLASVSSIIPVRSLRNYTIYFGPDVFRDGADSSEVRDTFIHELTHVWQGYHSGLGWEYMVESMVAQGHAVVMKGNRNKAYDYKPGEAWDSYNVEQQALIVQDWFRNGMSLDDERYNYITNNIRAGRN